MTGIRSATADTEVFARFRSVIARVNAGVAADVVRREKAEWERVIAEFEKLAPPNAVVRQVEVHASTMQDGDF